MQQIMENWRKYNNEPFQLMLEQYDKQILTEKQLFETWQKDTLRELEQLNEIDWEKEAKLTADPDYKPPQERPGMLAKGWEKVNDWILMKSIQLVDLAKRSAMAAIKSIAWLIKKVQSFCAEHKTICKIAIMTLVVIMFYIALSLIFENEAQAKLYRGKKPLNDTQINAIKGYLYDGAEMAEKQGGSKETFHQLIIDMEDLQSSETVHDILDTQNKTSRNLNTVFNDIKGILQDETKDASKVKKLLNKWLDVGERVKVWTEETFVKIRTAFGSKTSRTVKQGVELLPKVLPK